MAEFIIYQGLWNVNKRDFEREIIPMCQSEGLALAPWGAISQGRFRTAEQVAQREKESGAIRGGAGQSEAEKKISGALEKMGKEEFGGASITQMALAYVLNKTPNVFPLIGGTKISYLEDNIKALDIHLSDDQIARLESVTPFEQGFPYEMILHDPRYAQGKTLMPLHAHAGHIEWGRAPTAVGRD